MTAYKVYDSKCGFDLKNTRISKFFHLITASCDGHSTERKYSLYKGPAMPELKSDLRQQALGVDTPLVFVTISYEI